MSASRVLLVTGGSRGIGAAVARQAGREGYAVAVNYLSGRDEAAAVVGEIEAGGGRALALQADTARPAEVTAMFEAVDAAFGPVTHLFNNAGITGPVRRLAELEAGELERVMATNVNGVFLVAQAAVRRMSTAAGGAGGAIVNMSSRAGQLGGAGEWLHYAASKGAVDTFTVGLAREVGGEGIRVNAVAPGLIDTDMQDDTGIADRIATFGPSVPMGRAGTAMEVAEAVLWLLSERAAYVTGTVFDVSGGR